MTKSTARSQSETEELRRLLVGWDQLEETQFACIVTPDEEFQNKLDPFTVLIEFSLGAWWVHNPIAPGASEHQKQIDAFRDGESVRADLERYLKQLQQEIAASKRHTDVELSETERESLSRLSDVTDAKDKIWRINALLSEAVDIHRSLNAEDARTLTYLFPDDAPLGECITGGLNASRKLLRVLGGKAIKDAVAPSGRSGETATSEHSQKKQENSQ